MIAFLNLWVLVGLAVTAACGGLILVSMLRADPAVPPAPAAQPGPPADAESAALTQGAAGRGFAAEWLDLVPELEGALRQAAPSALRFGVELASAVQPALALRTDRHALRAALRLLLDQAVAAAPGGKVLLTARREGWVIEIAVLDDGPGADSAVRRGDLRPLDSAIALQGGSLEVTTSPGEGTTVRLRLPAPLPARPQAATPQSTPAATVWLATG